MSTLTFLMSHMVYFCIMKRNLGHIKVTQKPPQPLDYKVGSVTPKVSAGPKVSPSLAAPSSPVTKQHGERDLAQR